MYVRGGRDTHPAEDPGREPSPHGEEGNEQGGHLRSPPGDLQQSVLEAGDGGGGGGGVCRDDPEPGEPRDGWVYL